MAKGVSALPSGLRSAQLGTTVSSTLVKAPASMAPGSSRGSNSSKKSTLASVLVFFAAGDDDVEREFRVGLLEGRLQRVDPPVGDVGVTVGAHVDRRGGGQGRHLGQR